MGEKNKQINEYIIIIIIIIMKIKITIIITITITALKPSNVAIQGQTNPNHEKSAKKMVRNRFSCHFSFISNLFFFVDWLASGYYEVFGLNSTRLFSSNPKRT